MSESYEFQSVLTEWDRRTEKWVFATVPADVAADIEDHPHPPAGFNSIKVDVRIGATQWSTSIFPNADGSYALPIKKSVRSKQHIDTGDTVTIGLSIG